jgi:hypothetical protein
VSKNEAAGVDLFSDSLVRSYVDEDPRFIERHWLAELIGERLADPGCRFLLVTGEPGSGKTGLVAWLARGNRQWPRYFIRRDSQVPLNSGDARSLLFAVGHQLAAVHPDLFRPEKLELVVRQRVGEVTAGGRVVAVSIGDLEVSPFYQTARHVEVDQEAGRVVGELAGIEVGRLVADERFLEVSNLQYLALLDPAELLLSEEPEAQIVILVDALDELRYHRGSESVLGWLAACPQLPANVRFVLTSRPDERLLEVFRGRQAQWLREVEIDADSDEVEADLACYVRGFTGEPTFARALADQDVPSEHFVREAVARADGNFQYLAAFFRAIEHAVSAAALADPEEKRERRQTLRGLLRLEEVPAGLGELYAFFLALVRDAVAGQSIDVPGAVLGESAQLPAWEGLYQRVLGVLAVTLEPLTAAQIARFGKIEAEERWLQEALARLGQFLHREEGRYRLYHASFAEYLTAAQTHESHPDSYLDPAEWHRTVAAQALAHCGGGWLACTDGYAVAHTPAHLLAALAEAGDSPWQAQLEGALVRLVTDPEFLEAKVTWLASDHLPVAAEPPSRSARLHAPAGLGLDFVLADLRAAVAVVPDERVAQTLRVVDREGSSLRRWRPAGDPGWFAQQIYYRANVVGAMFLAASARDRLERNRLPYIELRWRAGMESPALERTIDAEAGPVTALDLAADRECAVAGFADGTLALCDLKTGRILRFLQTRNVIGVSIDSGKTRNVRPGVTAVAITPDTSHVVAGYNDGTVSVARRKRRRDQRQDIRGFIRPVPADGPAPSPASRRAGCRHGRRTVCHRRLRGLRRSDGGERVGLGRHHLGSDRRRPHRAGSSNGRANVYGTHSAGRQRGRTYARWTECIRRLLNRHIEDVLPRSGPERVRAPRSRRSNTRCRRQP